MIRRISEFGIPHYNIFFIKSCQLTNNFPSNGQEPFSMKIVVSTCSLFSNLTNANPSLSYLSNLFRKKSTNNLAMVVEQFSQPIVVHVPRQYIYKEGERCFKMVLSDIHFLRFVGIFQSQLVKVQFEKETLYRSRPARQS